VTTGFPEVDPGLLTRFRGSAPAIAWRVAPPVASVPRTRARGRSRIAHLHDEEARVEEATGRAAVTIRVDSGPVGALVLVLEIDQRGAPTALRSLDAADDARFPGGAIEASWGGPAAAGPGPTVRDLVALARYALA